MIDACEFVGPFQSKHVRRFFDNTNDGLVTLRVGANGTGVGFRDVRTHRAIPHPVFYIDKGACKAYHFFPLHLDDIEREAMRRLAADAGELGKLFRQLLDRFCSEDHWSWS